MRSPRLVLGAAVALLGGAAVTLAAGAAGPEDARSDRWTALRPAPLERTEVAAAASAARSTWWAGSSAGAARRSPR